MNLHFFDSTDFQLFGAYHPARDASQTQKVVLVCPPIGQEYVRSYWCLRLMAGQLARRGISVLRFDYSGIGDSGGNVDQIHSVSQWTLDIDCAIEHAKTLSQSNSVMLLGLRLGATLAAKVANSSTFVNSLLMWEPVHDGESYLTTQRRLHIEMLDSRSSKMVTENNRTAEELLGTRYLNSLLAGFSDLQIDWPLIQQPHFVFDLKSKSSCYEIENNPMRKIGLTEDENSWDDLRQLETAWLRPQTTRLIVDQVIDTFDRLERFNVLTGNDVAV